MHHRCLNQSPSSNHLEGCQLIRAFEYIASIHGETRDFNAPKMCRSTKNVPLQLSNFIRETHIRDGRITLLNSLGEIISSALYSSSVSLSNFLSSDYKMVSCFLHIRPRPRKSATTNQSASLSYKLAGLTAAFRSPQWSDCFPLTWLQRISIQTNANKQNLWM